MQKTTDSVLLSSISQDEYCHGTSGQTPGGASFAYMLSTTSSAKNAGIKGLYLIALPFMSPAHVLSIPISAAPAITPQDIPKDMTAVELEGDYGNYFRLYAGASEQSSLRYVLDPEAMAHSVDFLKRFHWEILGNILYFFDDSQLPELSVIDSFIQQIQPSNTKSPRFKISFMKKEKLLSVPTWLKCPLCNIKLKKGKNWMGCPDGHGYLMTASQLIQTRNDSASFEKQLAQMTGKAPSIYSDTSSLAHKDVHCPNCGHMMQQLRYQFSEITLDICRNCSYRWLDGSELNDILGAYRHE